MSGIATHDGITVESNTATDAEVRASFDEGQLGKRVQTPTPEPTPEQKPTETPAELPEGQEPTPESEAGKTLAAKRRSLEGKKQSIQSEIDALYRQKGETQRERDRIAAEVADLEAKKSALTGPARREPQPSPERFPDYDTWAKSNPDQSWDDWNDAKIEWRVDQRLTREREQAQVQGLQRAQASAMERVFVSGMQQHDDFEPVMVAALNAGLTWNPTLSNIILRHPLGHELAYQLARDPDESRRLNGMTDPIAAATEVGVILARLQAAHSGPAETKPRQISDAKPPIKPVGGSQPTSDDPPGDDASDDAHREYWNRKELARRRRA